MQTVSAFCRVRHGIVFVRKINIFQDGEAPVASSDLERDDFIDSV